MDARGARVTASSFIRHGSDEQGNSPRLHTRRFSSRERNDMRTSSLPAVERAMPVGPLERQEWLDALKDVEAKVATIDATIRTHAQGIAKIEDVVKSHEDRINELCTDRVAYKQYVESIVFESPNSIKNVFGKLEHKVDDVTNTTAEFLANHIAAVTARMTEIETALQHLTQ